MVNEAEGNNEISQRLERIENQLEHLTVQPIGVYGVTHQDADDEIDLRELWNVVWRGKWTIMAIAALFAIASVVYALSLPNIYQSRALLAPSEEAQGGGMSCMAGQLGGIASLAGLSLGARGGDNKVAVAIAVLKSRKFVERFVEKHNLLPTLISITFQLQ